MINRKSTFFLGIFIFVIPFLGVPSSWRTFFIVISGLTLIILSIKITLPKKNLKGRIRKEKITPVFVESIPVYPKENIVEGIITPNTEGKVDTIDDTTNRII
ncbi:MAG: hypothetical protein NTX96_00040 [Candidatus Zambryskibacteria bacterium]|nr:hypothetical protein [Candidatus Zambryskibacteria bacterium]